MNWWESGGRTWNKKNQLRGMLDPWGFPGGSVVKNVPANAGEGGLIPG